MLIKFGDSIVMKGVANIKDVVDILFNLSHHRLSSKIFEQLHLSCGRNNGC